MFFMMPLGKGDFCLDRTAFLPLYVVFSRALANPKKARKADMPVSRGNTAISIFGWSRENMYKLTSAGEKYWSSCRPFVAWLGLGVEWRSSRRHLRTPCAESFLVFLLLVIWMRF